MPSPKPIVSLATRLGTEELLARVACGPRPRPALYRAVYTAKVRIIVRAGEVRVVREGSGSCEATAATAGQAYELALKGAETDATKRALATFGNPFGLALYDPEQNGVRKQRWVHKMQVGPCVLRSLTVLQFQAMIRRLHSSQPCVGQ